MDEDHPFGDSWRYRDYVIRSFNSDLPFNRFALEQIAGDLLPSPDGSAINADGIIATGFLAVGPMALAQRDPIQKKYDVVDEQIDTTTKAFLGLTVACARCHDHKFDPILTTDYYALAGIFASTRTFDDWEQERIALLQAPAGRHGGACSLPAAAGEGPTARGHPAGSETASDPASRSGRSRRPAVGVHAGGRWSGSCGRPGRRDG